jgi:hypothetical protein
MVLVAIMVLATRRVLVGIFRGMLVGRWRVFVFGVLIVGIMIVIVVVGVA